MTALPPSPFISDSAASTSRAVDRAAVDKSPPVAAARPNSALERAIAADAAAAPDLTDHPVAAAGLIHDPAMETGGPEEAPAVVPHAAAGVFDRTDCIPELLARLNAGHPCDLDALRANKAKIDRNSDPPDRELLTFLQGEPPIYCPSLTKRKPRPAFIRALLELSH